MPKYEKRNTLTEVGSKQSEKEIWYKNSTKMRPGIWENLLDIFDIFDSFAIAFLL